LDSTADGANLDLKTEPAMATTSKEAGLYCSKHRSRPSDENIHDLQTRLSDAVKASREGVKIALEVRSFLMPRKIMLMLMIMVGGGGA